MAAAEIEGGARLFHRRPEANSWGVLNVREAFAAEHPRLTERVLRVYEEARLLATSDAAGAEIPVDEGGPTRIVFQEGTAAGRNADQWIWSLRTLDAR